MKNDRHDIIIERNVDCPMRDGTILRGDLYRRADGAPGPALVHRTPYGKMHPTYVTSLMIHPFDAVERGYALYVQDVRGRFTSDGEWTPFHCEKDDGYDTIEWAAMQSWCNGKVGIYGSSYMGVTAGQALAARPPHLGAAALYLTGTNYYDGFVYSGGAFELVFMMRWFAAQALDTLKRGVLQGEALDAARDRLMWIIDNPAEASKFRPLIDVFGPADPLLPHWKAILSHPDYDDFWKSVNPNDAIAQSRAPVLNIAGWYDGFLKGHLDVHAAIAGARRSGKPSPVEHFMIGPWDHESYISLRPSSAGDAFFGSVALGGQPGLGQTILGWFDRWLKGDEIPDAARDSGVRYFVMGANEWRKSADWPPSSSIQRTYFLSGGPANSSAGQGLLQTPSPGAVTVDRFIHDPANPVQTVGGRHLGYWHGHAGVLNQSVVETRHDVLVYTTPPLDEPITITGSVEAELFVRCTAKSADFALKLVDVRPDGYCANIVDGIRRVRWDEAPDAEGQAKRVTVELWDTAYVVPAGNRLRLEIAGSNSPRFDINDGHGCDWNLTSGLPAAAFEQQVLGGGAWASKISIQTAAD